MALDLPLPRQVLTHAHWTIGRLKMSKSRGNVVNPFFALDRFGVDTMRYYLALEGGIRDDSDYDNLYIIDRYKKGLNGGLGNLVSRVMRGKGWNVQRAVQSAATGLQPAEGLSAAEHRDQLMKLPELVTSKMEELDSGAALKEIMRVVYKARCSCPGQQYHANLNNRRTVTCKQCSHGICLEPKTNNRRWIQSSTSASNHSASVASYSNHTCLTR